MTAQAAPAQPAPPRSVRREIPADALPDPETIAAELSRAGVSDHTTSRADRAAFSSDGSLFRVVPLIVVFPRNTDDVRATLGVAHKLGVPLTSRGAGTSIAGNAIGPGIILNFYRHMNRVLDIDPAEQTAWVEPGCVHAALQKAAAPHRLRFGPDPSTNNRCTIGGMIGNNACGPRAMGYGRTSDNIIELEVLLPDGTLVTLDGTDDASALPRLKRLVGENLALIRTEFGRFTRQVSGYGLESLLPENGFDARRAFAGSEGTWGVITRAKMRLVRDPTHKVLVALGYDDMPTAADDVPVLSGFRVTACEGMDSRMLDRLKAERGEDAVPPLPRGKGWMFVEVVGETREELEEGAAALIEASAANAGTAVWDTMRATTLWKIRADAAGLVARTADGRPAHAGFEDSAVPPERLGDYLRRLDALLEEFNLYGLPYGHFGDGCVHMRVDFPLETDSGRDVMRDFMFAASRLVAEFGGSISGEHGDGRARSELLQMMYSPAALGLMGQVKALFDPQNLMNPGNIVDPVPLDESIRLATVRRGDMPPKGALGFAFHKDHGDFAEATHRCTGVGKCVADPTESGGTMCPSYLATKDEKHSTRGRARILQEMITGDFLDRSWENPEVHEALDLCLSCKACSSECPTGIDMAVYKSEVLHQTYKGKLRPRDHYVLGWLPMLARVAAPVARLANASLATPGMGTLAKKIAGVDRRRHLPAFVSKTFTKWWKREHPSGLAATEAKRTGEVILYADSWSNYFDPRILKAARDVLLDAGYDVRVIPQTTCCGLTWVSTGQLDQAKVQMSATVEALDATGQAPIIGIEPSCTATLREETVNLLDTDASRRVAARTFTIAEFLLSAGYSPPDCSGLTAIVQPHCHHNAVMGFAADEELLAKTGISFQRLGGCCGLAGNFGVVEGHYEVSEAVGEVALLPALRAADPDTIVLADGYSCRTQISDLSNFKGVSLPELLAWRLGKS